MKVLVYSLLLFTFLTVCTYAQGQKPYGEFSNPRTQDLENKILKAARKEFDFGNYDAASAKYLELLKIDSTNPMYNFEQAQTLYNSFRQPMSVKYYERAIKYSTDSLGEAYYFLASSYHLCAQFDSAQKNYRQYLKILNYHGSEMAEEEEIDLKVEISHKIEMCENGKSLYKLPPTDRFSFNGKPRPFVIEEAGKGVNSNYDDYGVVLSGNDSVMYFTSRREGTTGGKVDWDDKFFEDIFMSGLGRKGWGSSFPIGEPVNSPKHEAIISISPDGKTIYFYRGVKQGTFYFSNLQSNVWSKPEVLYERSDINTSAWETSFFGFAMAGSELYVVSDREGGMGGRDIYVSKKQADGNWGAMVNLGSPVNSQYDEDAPFITADGNTMYFSSKGHNSMGGFDIFKSQKDGDKWSQPVNLGRPFNTPGEDIYFVLANKNERAYFSSSSYAPDSTKDLDVFMVDFCDDVEEILLAGITRGITAGSISVSEKQSGQKIGDYNFENGKYAVRLKHGKNYLFTFNVGTGIDPVTTEIAVPRQCKVHDLYQELSLSPPTLVVRNAFFDIKKEAGTADYSSYLASLDKATAPLYSELSLPVSVALVVAATPTTAVSTPTATATTTTTVAAATTATTAVTAAAVVASTPTASVTPPMAVPTISAIAFDYDKSTMRPEFTAEVDKVVSYLKGNKNAKVEVIGHTDSKGTEEYNLALSKRRANAVAAYMAAKGINRGRITTTGKGESSPLAANENPDGSDNPDGRAKNRRTEVIVIR